MGEKLRSRHGKTWAERKDQVTRQTGTQNGERVTIPYVCKLQCPVIYNAKERVQRTECT
jgi:hypothetical protein